MKLAFSICSLTCLPRSFHTFLCLAHSPRTPTPSIPHFPFLPLCKPPPPPSISLGLSPTCLQSRPERPQSHTRKIWSMLPYLQQQTRLEEMQKKEKKSKINKQPAHGTLSSQCVQDVDGKVQTGSEGKKQRWIKSNENAGGPAGGESW